jgi:hypothetical protein
MKSPIKNQNEEFICEECQRTFKRFCDLSKHININHNKKEYYNKYLKEENEEFCIICGNLKPFIPKWNRGYRKTCCKKCDHILQAQTTKKTKKEKYGDENYHNQEKINQTNLEKYGNKCVLQNSDIQKKVKKTFLQNYDVENPLQSSEIQKRSRKTMKERYGAEYTLQSEILKEKYKKTNLEKYGVEHPSQNDEIFQKIKKTTKETTGFECNFQNRELMNDSMMKKHGVKNISQLKETQEKIINTNLKKYGYTHHFQNPIIFENAQRISFKIKQFKDTNIWYQGTYELNFLEKYYNKFYNNIQRGFSIKYKFNKKNKVYHSDFYILSLNLIIEIKSSYYYKKYRNKCNLKKKAAISQGYNYIMIVDKNYKKFDKLIQL